MNSVLMTRDGYGRLADLHFAYQHGQDAAKGDPKSVLCEFESKFGDDKEALDEFFKGFMDVASPASTLSH